MQPKLLTLRSGLRVVLAPRRETSTVSVHAFYAVGSRYESAAENGISHFLEHLVFKGTPRRPNAQALSAELDGVGAVHNAYTAKDRTSFHVKLPAERLDLAVDVVADITLNPLLDAAEVERERGVVLEEINMYEDNPMLIVDEVVEEQLFTGHPLSRRVIGPPENIRQLSRQAIASYHRRYYHPGNAVVVVAGRFKQEEALALIRQRFPAAERSFTPQLPEPFHPSQAEPRVVVQVRPVEQVQLALAFPGVALRHAELMATQVLANLLGGTMSSRLFSQVRERAGLCYSIQAYHEPMVDTGVFTVSAGLDRARLVEALSLIRQILDQAAAELPPAEEVERAKVNLIGRLTMKFEEASSLADWYGSEVLRVGTLETAEQRLTAISSVTPQQVLAAAARLFSWRQASLACIGPVEDAQPLRVAVAPR